MKYKVHKHHTGNSNKFYIKKVNHTVAKKMCKMLYFFFIE